jgi:dTDP-4-dehydrorhamnose reductase
MTRWLVTGAGGMLGRDLVAALEQRDDQVTGLDRAGLDVTDPAAVDDAVAATRPDVVVNCAAWTAVDDAEDHEARALAVNAGGPAHLAGACAGIGARLVQLSTDYVFAGTGPDGTGREPYREDDPTGPVSAYGRTKLAGERAVLNRLPGHGFVVRTAWLYGAHGGNFVRTMIGLEGRRPTVDVVDDQRGQPTWTVDVAGQIIALIDADATPGIYHATSSGVATWFMLAREVFRLLGADPDRVRPTSSAAMARRAPRPAYSVLGHEAWARAGLAPIGDWRVSLGQAFPSVSAAARTGAAAG